jgi:hypothetical protein
MRNTKNSIFILIGFFYSLPFSSCSKIYDKIFKEDKQAKKCRITSFTQNNIPAEPGSRTLYFHYNRHGNIDSIVSSRENGSPAAGAFYFYYDNNHKLITYREVIEWPVPHQIVHTYFYEDGRIVRDSSRRIPDSEFSLVTRLHYDDQGRIDIQYPQIILDDGSSIPETPTVFPYDAEGNLVVESTTYDEGINFLRTNEYLMFTQRDYSRNNRSGAIGYNEQGLPLGFAEGVWPNPSQSSLLSYGPPAIIKYHCK